jgi:hypothetical protein
MYKTALEGGGPFLKGSSFVGLATLLGIISVIFLVLIVTDVFQLSKYQAVLASVFGVMSGLLFILALGYGLLNSYPMPVDRRTVAWTALITGLVYIIVAVSVGLGAFSPASSDTKTALIASSGSVGGVVFVYGFIRAISSN